MSTAVVHAADAVRDRLRSRAKTSTPRSRGRLPSSGRAGPASRVHPGQFVRRGPVRRSRRELPRPAPQRRAHRLEPRVVCRRDRRAGRPEVGSRIRHDTPSTAKWWIASSSRSRLRRRRGTRRPARAPRGRLQPVAGGPRLFATVVGRSASVASVGGRGADQSSARTVPAGGMSGRRGPSGAGSRIRSASWWSSSACSASRSGRRSARRAPHQHDWLNRVQRAAQLGAPAHDRRQRHLADPPSSGRGSAGRPPGSPRRPAGRDGRVLEDVPRWSANRPAGPG